MMPMPPMGGGPAGAGSPPMPPSPSDMGGGGGAGGPSPDDVKQTLIQLLTQAKKMADSAGVDFMQLVKQVGGAGGGPAMMKPPTPPASARPAMPTGVGKANPEKGALTMSPNSNKPNAIY